MLPERVLATVLFTDVVDSTERASALGDRAWRELLEATRGPSGRSSAAPRRRGRHRGRRLLRHLRRPGAGDRCAQPMRDAFAALGIEIRAGLHTGESSRWRARSTAWPSTIGARVSAPGRAREILVSATVKTSSPAPASFDAGATRAQRRPGGVATLRSRRLTRRRGRRADRRRRPQPDRPADRRRSSHARRRARGQVLNALAARTDLDPAESRTSRWAASRRSASRAGTSAAWRRSSPAGRRPSAATPSTGSAAPRCRPTSTPPRRSGPDSSTSSSQPASR